LLTQTFPFVEILILLFADFMRRGKYMSRVSEYRGALHPA